jgi:hypothetical protein
MMMDGRFDQHFAELFAASLADEGKKSNSPSFWPLAVACICGLVVVASAAVLA